MTNAHANDAARAARRARDVAALVDEARAPITASARSRRHARYASSTATAKGWPTPALPDVVVFPHTNEEVAAIVRLCQRRAGPGHRVRRRHVARRPRRGALRRRLPRSVADEPRARGQRRGPRLPRPGRRHARAAQRRAQGHGALLPDRPGRQRDDRRHGVDPRVGHQRGALRHDARERARAHGRHRRRPDRAHRRPRAQVERRLRPDAAVRRRRRHARHHHRDPAAPLRHPRGDLGGRLPVSRPRRARSTR